MLEEIVVAGFGGQGVLVAGEILAIAGMLDNKNVAWMPEYGPETRGGTANCTVIISDEEIGSTVVDTPSCVMVMNQPSLEKFSPKIQSGGLIIVNASLISSEPKRNDITLLKIDANALAQQIGNPKSENLIMLGVYIAHRKIIPQEKIIEALKEWTGQNKKEEFLETNIRALRAGMEAIIQNIKQNPS